MERHDRARDSEKNSVASFPSGDDVRVKSSHGRLSRKSYYFGCIFYYVGSICERTVHSVEPCVTGTITDVLSIARSQSE